MTLQAFNSRRLQGFSRKLQAFAARQPTADRKLVDICISNDDIIYLADYDNHKIARYNLDGTFIDEWGDYGANSTPDGKIDRPFRVHVYNSEVFVVSGNFNIQVFSTDGVWDRTIINGASDLVETGASLISTETISFYNGEFWNVAQKRTGSPKKSVFRKYDTNGNREDTFTISNYTTESISLNDGQIRAFVISQSAPTTNTNYVKTYAVDGTEDASINVTAQSSSEKIITKFIFSPSNIYSATQNITDNHIRKHSTGGTYLSRSTGLNTLQYVIRLFYHTDGRIYCIMHDIDNKIYNYVQVYNGSTLALIDEWQAT